jgi:Ser/Thr protein kinase RdoA (MazF antagonist)
LAREDDPDLLLPYADRLERLCRSASQRRDVQRIRQQLDLVRCELDGRLWPRLPKAIIHGDIHTGNVCFRNSRVSAVYDFDYLSLQARVRDLCDAIMFFAADRPRPVDPGDIYSLTAPYRLDADQAAVLLGGYADFSPLVECEWEAIPWVLRSQWCQIRLRGGRKVREEDRLDFVLHRFFEQIDWLNDSAPQLIATARERAQKGPKGGPKGDAYLF